MTILALIELDRIQMDWKQKKYFSCKGNLNE